MKELTSQEINNVNGGILPVLVAYYLGLGSGISSVYTVAKWFGED